MKKLLLFSWLLIVLNAYPATLKTDTAAWQINPKNGALMQIQRLDEKGMVVEDVANHYFLMKKSGDEEAFESEDKVVSQRQEGKAFLYVCLNPKLKDIQITKKYWQDGIYLRREITFANAGGETVFITPRTHVTFEKDFYKDAFYLGSGYIGPLIPVPDIKKPQKEARYKQTTRGMLIYNDPQKGSFAQYRTDLNGKFVFPWFQSAIPNYIEKDNYLHYMPRGWEMSLSTIDVLPGKTFSIEDCFVFFHGSWYDFINDIYVKDPKVDSTLSAIKPGPEWLADVKVYKGYQDRDDLQKLLELVEDGNIMVLVDVLDCWADYRIWDKGRAGQWGGFIKAEEMKKAIADIKSMSPRIKVGIYNWINSVGISSPVFRENPEYFMIKERNGQHKNFFPGGFIQNYPTMVNRPEAAKFMINMFAGIIDYLGVDYIYLDETKTFNLVDWEKGDLVREDHWYDVWKEMKELGNKTNTMMFGNGRANPYSDLNFIEARHQLRPEVWREFVGMGMAMSAFVNHRPGGRLCLLYWNPNLDYITRVMANGFVPAIHSLRFQQIPYLTANAELGKTSILNLKYTPDWKNDPKTELETYATTRNISGETVFSIINRGNNPVVEVELQLPQDRECQIWEYRIDKYRDGASEPYGLGEKNVRENYRDFRWREGLAASPRLLRQGKLNGNFKYRSEDFGKDEFRQLVISPTPAGVYSVNDMPHNYFFTATPEVKISGGSFPLQIESQADQAEIILFTSPARVTVNSEPVECNYAEFGGKIYPVIKIAKGRSKIELSDQIAVKSVPFKAILENGKLKLDGNPGIVTVKRDGKLLYCGSAPALSRYHAAGDIELNTLDGKAPVKLSIEAGKPTAAMLVEAAPKHPQEQKIEAVSREFEGVKITSSASYTSAWDDGRHIQVGMPPFSAAADVEKLSLEAGTTDKIVDYFGHAYAGMLLENAEKVQLRLEHTFLTGGGILRTHLNRYYLSATDFAGIMLDYQTAKGFHRVALGCGVMNYDGTPGMHPWGGKRRADRKFDLGNLIDRPSPAIFSLDLKQYAPAGWNGKVWLSAGTSRVRPGRRLKATVEHFNAKAVAPVLKGIDADAINRELSAPRELYIPQSKHTNWREIREKGVKIPHFYLVGNKGMPSHQTSAAIARDDKNIYIYCEYEESQPDFANEIEIWLYPAPKRSYQLRIFSETHFDVQRNSALLLDSGVQVVQPQKNSYLVTIPMKLPGKLQDEKIQFNICRLRPSTPTEDRELSSWSALKRGFVETANFGTLLFKEPKYTTEVFNYGKGGITSGEVLRYLLPRALEKKPTTTIVMVGTNDMLNSKKLASPEAFEKNLDAIVERLRNAGSQVILATIPPCIESLVMRRHKEEAYKGESPSQRINDANAIIRKIAAANNLPLYDLYDVISKHAPLESAESLLRNLANLNSPDGVHLTPQAAAILGHAMAAIIREKHFDTSSVVCLGDSNTYGANLKGAGTTEHEPYPAVLLRELTNNPKEQ